MLEIAVVLLLLTTKNADLIYSDMCTLQIKAIKLDLTASKAQHINYIFTTTYILFIDILASNLRPSQD